MSYIAVRDLKQTKVLWNRLRDERELIITREGKPCAIMVEVSPENVEDSLNEIRRAIFSSAITRARRKAEQIPISPQEIENVIQQSRRERQVL